MPKKKLLSPILLSASSEVILGLVKDRHTYSHIYEMSFQLTVVDHGTLTNPTNDQVSHIAGAKFVTNGLV